MSRIENQNFFSPPVEAKAALFFLEGHYQLNYLEGSVERTRILSPSQIGKAFAARDAFDSGWLETSVIRFAQEKKTHKILSVLPAGRRKIFVTDPRPINERETDVENVSESVLELEVPLPTLLLIFRPALLQSKNDNWCVQSSSSQKLTVLVGCVDNQLARREMHEALKYHNEQRTSGSSPRLWWIDGGNGRDTGQVLIGNRFDEKAICEAAQLSPILSILPAPSLQHPELIERESAKSIKPRNQATGGSITCAERIRLGEQSLNVNQRVAVEMSEILSELLLTQTLKRFANYFDLESGASRSVYNTPEAISATANYKPKRKSKNHRNKNKSGE